MNRWLEKLGNAPGSELTKVPKGRSVSFGSTPTAGFEEKNAPGVCRIGVQIPGETTDLPWQLLPREEKLYLSLHGG